MATLKAIVKAKMKNGMYNVYIRFTQNRQFSYFRTLWMVMKKVSVMTRRTSLILS